MDVMSRGIHSYQLPILQQPNDAIGILIRKCREQQIAVIMGLCLHKHSGTFNLLKHLGLFVVFKPAVIKKRLRQTYLSCGYVSDSNIRLIGGGR